MKMSHYTYLHLLQIRSRIDNGQKKSSVTEEEEEGSEEELQKLTSFTEEKEEGKNKPNQRANTCCSIHTHQKKLAIYQS